MPAENVLFQFNIALTTVRYYAWKSYVGYDRSTLDEDAKPGMQIEQLTNTYSIYYVPCKILQTNIYTWITNFSGPIDNSCLLNQNELKPDLKETIQYELVPKPVWEQLAKWFALHSAVYPSSFDLLCPFSTVNVHAGTAVDPKSCVTLLESEAVG